jgi:hypothetical protein
MKKAVTWIVGIIFALVLVAWVFYGRSERQAYRAAKGVVEQRVQLSQERIDTAVAMAAKSVDLALVMAGNLPSQQAEADLVKQDIEEIGNRLKEASELKGDLAIAKLDASIELFNKTLDAVDSAAKKAENPEVKSALDRIYGILLSAREQLSQVVLKITD